MTSTPGIASGSIGDLARRFGLSALTGCLLFLACARFDIWPFAWIGFLPLLFAVQGQPLKRSFLLGWAAGTVANAGGFYWISNLLVRFGELPQPIAFLLFLLLAAYQGLHWGVWAVLVERTKRRFPALPYALLAPVFMAALELVMPFIFDWYISITQAWVIPVIQVADLTGPIGVTALLMLANGTAFDVASTLRAKRAFPTRTVVAATAVVALALGYGFIRIAQVNRARQQATKINVGIVQANIGIYQKGRMQLANEQHQLHLRESRKLQAEGADLLVWPESSYPYAINRRHAEDFRAGDPRRVMQGLNVPLIFGALSYDPAEEFPYNTAFEMNPDGRIVGRFDKNFLLVFGEYIPFYQYVPNFRKWIPAASNFARGTTVTTFPFRGYQVAPLICYEDILPSFGRRLAKLEPNLLVNITNDAWFGETSEPYEHLALSVYRSVELRLDLVRAVNTGVSATIDATGRVMAKTPSFDPVMTPGVPPSRLVAQVALLPSHKTVYGQIGDAFGYLTLAASLLLVLQRRRRAD